MTDDDLTPAERRVHQLLDELEDEPPRSELAASVVRTARWQRAVRGSVAMGGELAAIFGTAVRLALGPAERRR
jgi:hypothetical protein